MGDLIYLKRLVENVLDESANMIKEYYEGDDFIVYHCAHEETLPSLFKFGFEAYFTARGVGNAYGRGVYTTFSLRSTVNNAKRGEYGRAILKCKIRSFKNFLIFDKGIAQITYGENWRIENQLQMLLDDSVYKEIEQNGILNRLCTFDNGNITSPNAGLAAQCVHSVKGFGDRIEGYVFTGRHDGNVVVVRDFKNVIPIEYSLDMGNTWKEIPKTKAYMDNIVNDVDLKYKLGNKYTRVPYNFTNGFAKVEKGGQVNYLKQDSYDKGVISNVWFDNGADTFSKDGYCLVYKDDTPYYISYDESDDSFSILNNDKEYLCDLEDFEDYLVNGGEDFSQW